MEIATLLVRAMLDKNPSIVYSGQCVCESPQSSIDHN